jgi:hypothetical protein
VAVGRSHRGVGSSRAYLLDEPIDVEDTASAVLEHAGGARTVLFATNAGVVDSPITMEIVTERATLHPPGSDHHLG